MNVKKIVSIAAAALMSTGALALAAPGQCEHDGKSGLAMHGQMAEKLNLSEAQKTQMQELMTGFEAENQGLMDAMKQTRQQLADARKANDTAPATSLAATAEQQRADMKQRREAQHEKMLQFLTPEQRTQMQQMRSQMEQDRSERGERGVKRMKGRAHQGGAAKSR